MGENRHGSGWRAIAAGFAFELVIVFVGVYLASALSNYQQRQHDEGRRTQMRHALISEISDVTEITRKTSKNLTQFTTYYATSIRAGKRPPLQPLLAGANVAHPMWQATLNSGGLDLFDVKTFSRISRFYGDLDDGLEELDKLGRLSIQELVPRVGMPASEFYMPNDSLKPKFYWYLTTVNSVLGSANTITALGDSLVQELGDSTTRKTTTH